MRIPFGFSCQFWELRFDQVAFIDQGDLTSIHSPNQKSCKDCDSSSAISIPKENQIMAIFFNDIDFGWDGSTFSWMEIID
jgi:hypothetical protein